MTDRVSAGNLRVARVLYDFVNDEALPGTDIDPDSFWAGVDKVVTDLTPGTRSCCAAATSCRPRSTSGTASASSSRSTSMPTATSSSKSVTCCPEPEDFTITTSGVDDEITTTAGPQLVVPVLNARFALNAANARWGSLYDALYGTDVIPETDGAERVRATTRFAATR